MKNPRFSDSVCFLLIAYCLVLSANVCSAAIPHLIRYQGQAVDTKGVPLEGPYSLTFRLYDAETNGNKLWEEAQTNVQLSGGHFSVLLGQQTPLTTIDWSQTCWLSVQVNGEPELSPRQQITSVPLAVRAERAETAERLTTSLATSTITDDANSLVPSGAIILWNNSTCPAGYTRLSAYDGKFLVGSATPGSPGGSNTHTHGAGSYAGPSHTHTGTTGGELTIRGGHGQVDGYEATQPHQHNFTTAAGGVGAVTGASGSTDSRPEFLTILLCQKN